MVNSDQVCVCACGGGGIAQWPEHLQLKWEILGLIPGGCPGFFFLFQLAY